MPASLVCFSFTVLVLLLGGCSGTTTELPDKLENLRVTIEAEHLTDFTGNRQHDRHRVSTVLANMKGAAIERADVRIEVNGTPMRFGVGQGNYYDRYPRYRLDGDDAFELVPGTDYRFVLVLPDGVRHDIGTLRAPAALSVDQIDFPRKAPASGPVTIAWRNLAEAAQLRLGRTEQRREADGRNVTEGSGPYDPDTFRRTIGPGGFRRHTDRLVVPAELLVSTPDRKLLWLEAEITVTGEGRMSSAFARQSVMKVTRQIQLQMRFEEGE